MAYFNQANKEVEIQGPGKKYPKMTAAQYIADAIQRNYNGVKNLETNGLGCREQEREAQVMGKAASAI